jgi:hypothetical protein
MLVSLPEQLAPPSPGGAFLCSVADRIISRMPPSDLDIARAAHQWIQMHGDNATAKAREMVETMRKKGDEDGADVWLRIIAAIGTLARRRPSRHRR